MTAMVDMLFSVVTTLHERYGRARACWRAYRNGLAVRVTLVLPPGIVGEEFDYTIMFIDPVTDMTANIPMKPRRIAVRVREG